MTRTSLDYKPRHKKPDGWAGSTPKGPHRWARAAANAMTNPRSEAAKLYRARVANAAYFDEKYPITPALEFRQVPNTYRENKRLYSVCSTYCATMQVQLEFGTLNREHILNAFDAMDPSSIKITWLNRSALTRDVHCQCCGSKIRAKR